MRGYKLGLLTTADYNNLCQCETLEDIKLYLVGGWVGLALRCCAGACVKVGHTVVVCCGWLLVR